MNAIIEFFNWVGIKAASSIGDILIQSSLLIGVLWLLDQILRRKARASFRYALGCLILIKLVLPPNMAMPTSPVYWWPSAQGVAVIEKATAPSLPTSKPITAESLPAQTNTTRQSSAQIPSLSANGWMAFIAVLGMIVLSYWLWRRTHLVARMVKQAQAAPDSVQTQADQCRVQMGIRQSIEVRISNTTPSPALCGVLHPVILIPESLVKGLTPSQLRAVFLHELAHVKRGDAWINTLQTLLQIAYWWHPLLWFANAHIRRLREQATDELVVVTLQAEAEIYPGTLIEVAKATLRRPFLALGLLGILESRNALKQRIHLLLANPMPASTKLGWTGILALTLTGLILLPMARAENTLPPAKPKLTNSDNPPQVAIVVHFIKLPLGGLSKLGLGNPPIDAKGTNWILSENEMEQLDKKIEQIKSSNEDIATLKLITLSERQSCISKQSSRTIVTGVETNFIPQTNSSGKIIKGVAINYLTTNMQFGPSINLIPKVSDNLDQIQILAIANITAFFGYDEPPKPFPTVSVEGGEPLTYTPPLPRYGKFQHAARTNIPNGGAMLISAITTVPFKSEDNKDAIEETYQLLVVVAPVVITPQGYLQPPHSPIAQTVYSPQVGDIPRVFPIITAAQADRIVKNGELTVAETMELLKTFPNHQIIGFDMSFLEKYGRKGVTLFQAGSITLAGRPETVSGVVEPLPIRKSQTSTRVETRIFRVNPAVFSQNLSTEVDKLPIPERPAPLDALIYQLRCENVDISRNEVTYTPATGEIQLQATQNNLDRAEAAILTLNQPNDKKRIKRPDISPSRVVFECRFISMPTDDFVNLTRKYQPNTGTTTVWTLSKAEQLEITRNIEKNPKAVMFSSTSVVTVIGLGGLFYCGTPSAPTLELSVFPLPHKHDLSLLVTGKGTHLEAMTNELRWAFDTGTTAFPRNKAGESQYYGELAIPNNGGPLIRLSPTNQTDTPVTFVLLTASRPDW